MRSVRSCDSLDGAVDEPNTAFHLIGSDDPWALYSPSTNAEVSALETQVQETLLRTILDKHNQSVNNEAKM